MNRFSPLNQRRNNDSMSSLGDTGGLFPTEKKKEERKCFNPAWFTHSLSVFTIPGLCAVHSLLPIHMAVIPGAAAGPDQAPLYHQR